MTAAEWDACADPRPMLDFLHDKASDRKLRLFACAYARTGSWLAAFGDLCGGHFYEGWGRQKPAIDVDAAQAALLALRRPIRGSRPCTFQGSPPFADEGEALVSLAERYADSAAVAAQVAVARDKLGSRCHDARLGAAYCGPSAHLSAEQCAVLLAAVAPTGREAAAWAVASVDHYFVSVADSGRRRALNPAFREPLRRQTLALQADLLRELFGPLAFRAVPPDPSRLAWDAAAVAKAAQTIYGYRAFGWMPLLADFLEEAGCTDAELRRHCRSHQEHARGCWALDLVLGKA